MSSSTTAFAMAAPRAGTASNLVVSTADGQTVIDTAPTRTATGGLSVIETDNGQPTTFPLTISADISLVPVVTTTSQSLLSPKLALSLAGFFSWSAESFSVVTFHRNLPSLLQYSWRCVSVVAESKAPEILVAASPGRHISTGVKLRKQIIIQHRFDTTADVHTPALLDLVFSRLRLAAGFGDNCDRGRDESTNVDDAQLRGVQEKLELAMLQIEGLNNRIQELEVHQKALSAEPSSL
ncbi:hypothetical protein B0H14DRAFT_3472668 [Mycena olivaceomarginata]|nr:hypothetical protein B0H14DRAFT_3472668 [Mycena olivaceomarginata]